jgi:shikimate kinase
MAAGKTTVGRRVAELTGADCVDLDQSIEQARGRPVAEIFAEQGEAAFRAAERELFQALLAPDRVIALGGGAPLQDEIWDRVRTGSLSVFLEAPLGVLRRRLGSGAGRPLAAGDLERLLRARLARYREADHTVDGARPVEEVATEVVSLWTG